MRAFSMGLYYKCNKFQEIQQELQIFLRKLIKNNVKNRDFAKFR